MKLLDLAKEEAARRARGEPPIAAPVVRATFAARTGQRAKVLVGDLGIVLGGLMIVANWMKVFGEFKPALSLGGMAVAAVAMAWKCASVRCPRCGMRVVWHTFSRIRPKIRVSPGQELTCPRCGYDPD